jgi:diamine N-acetyltransferase
VLNNENDFFNVKQLRLMIEEKNSGKTIGSIDLFDLNVHYHRAELGVMLVEDFQKKGLAEESLEVFIQYIKKYLGLHQVYSTIPSNNIASIKLFTKMGFETAGVKKEWIKEGDNWVDLVFMQFIF